MVKDHGHGGASAVWNLDVESLGAEQEGLMAEHWGPAGRSGR